MSRFRRKANHAHVYEIARQNETHVTLRSLIENVLPRRTFEEDYEPVQGEPATMACEDLAREALEPFAKAAMRLRQSGLLKDERLARDVEASFRQLHEDFASRARTAYDAIGSGVKALDVDGLAQEIRRVDGRHDLGAGALAEALMPYLSTHTAAGAGSVGEAVAWTENAKALLELNEKGAVTHPVPGLAVSLLRRAIDLLAARTVEEPGEVERDPLCCCGEVESRHTIESGHSFVDAHEHEVKTLEAALAEMRERLEKVEAEADLAATIMEGELKVAQQPRRLSQDETSSWDEAVQVKAECVQRIRAALTGDAQEAAR